MVVLLGGVTQIGDPLAIPDITLSAGQVGIETMDEVLTHRRLPPSCVLQIREVLAGQVGGLSAPAGVEFAGGNRGPAKALETGE
ncbi:MAG: hypothetical protein AB7E52_09585, partial [Bdellovibrionales bacterium]